MVKGLLCFVLLFPAAGFWMPASASDGVEEETRPCSDRRQWLVYLDISKSHRAIRHQGSGKYQLDKELTDILRGTQEIARRYSDRSAVDYFVFGRNIAPIRDDHIQLEDSGTIQLPVAVLNKVNAEHTILGGPLRQAVARAIKCPRQQFIAAISSDFISDPPRGSEDFFPRGMPLDGGDSKGKAPLNLQLVTLLGSTERSLYDDTTITGRRSDFDSRSSSFFKTGNYTLYALQSTDSRLTHEMSPLLEAGLKNKWVEIAGLPLDISRMPSAERIQNAAWYCGQTRLRSAIVARSNNGFAEPDPCLEDSPDCSDYYILRGKLNGILVQFSPKRPDAYICGSTIDPSLGALGWHDLGAALAVLFEMMFYGDGRAISFEIRDLSTGGEIVLSRRLLLTKTEDADQPLVGNRRSGADHNTERRSCEFKAPIGPAEAVQLQKPGPFKYQFFSDRGDIFSLKGGALERKAPSLEGNAYKQKLWRYMIILILVLGLLKYFELGWGASVIGVILTMAPLVVERTPDLLQLLAAESELCWIGIVAVLLVIVKVYRKKDQVLTRLQAKCAMGTLSTQAMRSGKLRRLLAAHALALFAGGMVIIFLLVPLIGSPVLGNEPVEVTCKPAGSSGAEEGVSNEI